MGALQRAATKRMRARLERKAGEKVDDFAKRKRDTSAGLEFAWEGDSWADALTWAVRAGSVNYIGIVMPRKL